MIATTSKLLSTGADCKMTKLIVLDEMISSMTEFKQIIGRGTRLREKEGKTHFVVMDFRAVTRLFADPDWDGPIEIDEGFTPGGSRVPRGGSPEGGEDDLPIDPDPPRQMPVVDAEGCTVRIINKTVSVYDTNGKLLRQESIVDYTKSNILGTYASLDNFIRQTLYEALSNGMEAGIVARDGNKKPIGMIRQVGDGVTVTGGAYPEKAAVKVDDLSPHTVGNLLSIVAADPNGKPRQVRDVILLVNPQDYLQKVMPATTLMAPDGTYRNDVLPYPMDVIQTPALPRGKAVIGIAYRYLAMAGTSPEGRIEYSDHYRFLEDERVYLIKAYANGMPLDNNAFLVLDISGLTPATYKVTQVDPPAASTDATLTALTVGDLALTPAFASDTLTYTATATNASDVVTAVPGNAAAAMKLTVNGTEINNGTAATWKTGSNTLQVVVTAADGTTTKTYKVTVTKS